MTQCLLRRVQTILVAPHFLMRVQPLIWAYLGIILGVGGLVALAAIPVHLMMIMIRLGGLIVITMAGVIMVAI
ncbi:MAG: hypothetical protein F6K19_26095, partial [Cyanothece sp. SIO1E1]|nr:hypothetical protein [Cyanothece sp. SIO1E1]